MQAFARYAGYVAKELSSELTYIMTINEANMGYQLHKVEADMKNAPKREGDVQGGVQVDMKKILVGMIEQMWYFKTLHVNSFLSPRKKSQEQIVMLAHQAAKAEIKKYAPQAKVGLTLSVFDYQPDETGTMQANRLWAEDFGFYLPYIQEDDFLGVQNYSRKVVTRDGAVAPAADVPITQMGYEDYPRSVGNVVRKIAKEFSGNLIVTENGIATMDDQRRCEFLQEAVASVIDAQKDGIPVLGYCCWSLLDNFEWQSGFDKKFGLIGIDRKTQKRMPKESLYMLGKLAQEILIDGYRNAGTKEIEVNVAYCSVFRTNPLQGGFQRKELPV